MYDDRFGCRNTSMSQTYKHHTTAYLVENKYKHIEGTNVTALSNFIKTKSNKWHNIPNYFDRNRTKAGVTMKLTIQELTNTTGPFWSVSWAYVLLLTHNKLAYFITDLHQHHQYINTAATTNSWQNGNYYYYYYPGQHNKTTNCNWNITWIWHNNSSWLWSLADLDLDLDHDLYSLIYSWNVKKVRQCRISHPQKPV